MFRLKYDFLNISYINFVYEICALANDLTINGPCEVTNGRPWKQATLPSFVLRSPLISFHGFLLFLAFTKLCGSYCVKSSSSSTTRSPTTESLGGLTISVLDLSAFDAAKIMPFDSTPLS